MIATLDVSGAFAIFAECCQADGAIAGTFAFGMLRWPARQRNQLLDVFD